VIVVAQWFPVMTYDATDGCEFCVNYKVNTVVLLLVFSWILHDRCRAEQWVMLAQRKHCAEKYKIFVGVNQVICVFVTLDGGSLA